MDPCILQPEAARFAAIRQVALYTLLPSLILSATSSAIKSSGFTASGGGFLAKAASKPLFGAGLAALLAAASSAGSALLMLHFAARIPVGDTIVVGEAAFDRMLRVGALFDRLDSVFRRWPAAALALLAIALALACAAAGAG
ncbi:hypothetical protein DFR50_11593 [Roseiarcus fermentans]|uniref:Uncharacterized protein n=1 Tax=Roseiarcus fermentans TaxID=1473586 RepID=A0A366FD21_9HYPH|nr:hypothetical protein DFR50_11593 [Roseiarcus fermentans]